MAIIVTGVGQFRGPGAGGPDEIRLPKPAVTFKPVTEGFRLVALGRAGIEIPEAWAYNAVECGNPVADTVVIDLRVVDRCVDVGPTPVESVSLGWSASSEEALQGRDHVIDGMAARSVEASCAPWGTAVWCRGMVWLPGEGVSFSATSATREGVEAILARIRTVPGGHVAVPVTGDLLYERAPQHDAGTLYGGRLRDDGLRVRYVRTAMPGLTPDSILGVDPAAGTVVLPGTTVTVTVVAAPSGSAQALRVSVNSTHEDDGEGANYRYLTDEQVRADGTLYLDLGDRVWVHATGKASETLTGELAGEGLAVDDWTDGPNYPLSWDVVARGTTTITLAILLDGQRIEVGSIRVVAQ